MKWDIELCRQISEIHNREMSSEEARQWEERLMGLNKEYMYELMRLYQKGDKEQMYLMLRQGQKISKAFEYSAENSQRLLAYYMGLLGGITYEAGFLFRDMAEKREFPIVMKGLCAKAHYSNILKYLYRHPSARHKDIVEFEKIKPGFLTTIMKDLEKNGAVKKYCSGKAVFYELTIDGKEFVGNLEKTDNGRIPPDYIGMAKTGIRPEQNTAPGYLQKSRAAKLAKIKDAEKFVTVYCLEANRERVLKKRDVYNQKMIV